jgi:hypothetical protein
LKTRGQKSQENVKCYWFVRKNMNYGCGSMTICKQLTSLENDRYITWVSCNLISSAILKFHISNDFGVVDVYCLVYFLFWTYKLRQYKGFLFHLTPPSFTLIIIFYAFLQSDWLRERSVWALSSASGSF